MKKFLLVFLTIITTVSFAQSLEVVEGDSLVEGDATTSTEIFGEVTVKNISSVDKTYLVKRIDKNYTNLTDSNAICWGVCFLPHVSVSPQSIEIKSGEEFAGFSAHVYPDQDGYRASGPISYVFYDINDPTDSMTYTMHFYVEGVPNPLSLNESSNKNKLELFPNPASGKTKVTYNCEKGRKYTFELYNMLGTKVFAKPFNGSIGFFEFDADKLSKGVYFYVLKSDASVLESKKLLIK